jgi:hypothetical protein
MDKRLFSAVCNCGEPSLLRTSKSLQTPTPGPLRRPGNSFHDVWDRMIILGKVVASMPLISNYEDPGNNRTLIFTARCGKRLNG